MRPENRVNSTSGSTAEKLLDTAQSLIQQRGYNGFSYEDLAQIVGIRKPSIHHHFPKKEDLGARVIQRYTERFKEALDALEKDASTPLKRLDGYITLFCNTYEPGRKLCPGGILGAESGTLPESIGSALKAFFALNVTWLSALLEDGRAQRQFVFAGNADRQALFLLSALEGAMVVGKGLGSDDSVSLVSKALIAHLSVQMKPTP